MAFVETERKDVGMIKANPVKNKAESYLPLLSKLKNIFILRFKSKTRTGNIAAVALPALTAL